MQINVSADDIAKGNVARDACPITLALRKKFGDNVSVSRDFIRYKNKKADKLILVPLPKKAQNFLLDTMGHSVITPFSFNLSKEAIRKLRG